MHLKISLDLTALTNTHFSTNFYFEFNNISSNIENWYDPEENVTALEFYNGTSTKTMYVFVDGATIPTYDQRDDLYELADVRDQPIIFECDIPERQYDRLYEFYKLGIIDIIPSADKTVMLAFRLNSDRDHVNKDLKLVTIIEGSFKAPLGVKSFELDVISYDIDNSYNYVYIPRLKRYYYVSTPQLVTNSYTKLILQEDVLLTWRELIKSQSAFVTRYSGSTEKGLVDVRFPLEDKLTTEYIMPTPSASSLVNTTLSAELSSTVFKILVSTVTDDLSYKHDVSKPTGTTLPSFTSLQARNERNAFITYEQLSYLIDACLADDNITTFINSVILLPFDPSTPYTGASTDGYISYFVQAKDKFLCDDGLFHATGHFPPDVNIVSCKGTTADACPYFIVADFTLSSTNAFNSYLDYEPYSVWEIYVPFVGWIKLNAQQCLNDRILVYYTLDYKSGMGTAYIYNYTKSKLLWSSNCQFGIKLDLTSTNAIEITRQKQANELNMILGLVASAVSVGVGIATENPVAVVGGVLSASKTIASAVNSNNMLFERAQTSFGTSEGIFHSPFSVEVRRTYHAPIITIDDSVYLSLQGKPYNKYMSLTTLVGYAEIGDIHFDPKGENIYNVEIDEIVALLKNGVIF